MNIKNPESKTDQRKINLANKLKQNLERRKLAKNLKEPHKDEIK